jgi:hypothetical protein
MRDEANRIWSNEMHLRINNEIGMVQLPGISEITIPPAAVPNEYCLNLLRAIRNADKSEIINLMLELRMLSTEDGQYLEEKGEKDRKSTAKDNGRITPENCQAFGLQLVDLSGHGQETAALTMYEERGYPKSRTIVVEWNSLDHATYIFQYDVGQKSSSDLWKEKLIEHLVYFAKLFEVIPSCAIRNNLSIKRISDSILDVSRRNEFDRYMTRIIPNKETGIAKFTGFVCRVFHRQEFANFRNMVVDRISMNADALRAQFPYANGDKSMIKIVRLLSTHDNSFNSSDIASDDGDDEVIDIDSKMFIMELDFMSDRFNQLPYSFI